MAKGQKRSGREAKKPAASKQKSPVSSSSVSTVLAKPKRGAETPGGKK
jgi:hypothetical protein